MRRCFCILALAIGLLPAAVDVSSAAVTCKQDADGVTINIDGKFFTKYVTGKQYSADVQRTPICYPILGPTGKKMTRDFPMQEGPASEKQDHPHHRSLWFTHGDVNGRSFWHQDPILHTKFRSIECDGEKAVLVTENDWVSGENAQTICKDVRTLTFGKLGDARYIDFDITITPVVEKVVFGDTKEGTMGVRVPGTMKVDAAKNNPEWGGHIRNSNGEDESNAWGKRASWVDYYGPVDGETLGIAILNHPSSFRYPTWWHVRTYGLFAANPFGASFFEGKDHDGTLELAKGESLTLRYRIIFHEGDTEEAKIGDLFEEYAKVKKD